MARCVVRFINIGLTGRANRSGDDTHYKKQRSRLQYVPARGMIPIEKNIIVTDVDGRRIGTTYPKRAKGLLKNGRAEYVSDREIRLKNTHASAVYNITEDERMSKVINFNTKDFVFDANCESNVGFRGWVTTPNGNEEIWEIGNWHWDWTQIVTELKGLEPDTDYIFRFAMTLGHNDDNKEESLVNIYRSVPDEDPGDTRPEDDPERIREKTLRKKAWDDRYTYCIRQSRFQPVISKRDPGQDTMLRVFELPFRTDSCTDWKVMIAAQHAVARFFRAKDNEAYAGLEDLSYEQWREARTKTLQAKRQANFMGLPEEFFEGMSFPEGIPTVPEGTKYFLNGIPVSLGIRGNMNGKLNLAGAHITSERMFNKLIGLAASGMNVDLSGAFVDIEDGDEAVENATAAPDSPEKTDDSTRVEPSVEATDGEVEV